LPGTLEVVEQIANALGSARAQGVVFAGLHPGAILVEHGPGPELRVIGCGPGGGRSRYTAPEEHVPATQDADERADQFSLAAIAFEMLSGRPPFTEDDLDPVADAGPGLPGWCPRRPPPHEKRGRLRRSGARPPF